MNNSARSPSGARFWVRPYEFEGDGSPGAAADVASLQVGGKTRMFWLKTLENRLFFREVERDEQWNFGALEELSDAEKLDLPLALANVLASENYGRVVLPFDAPRPCLFLAGMNNQFWFSATRSQARKHGDWKPHKSNKKAEFLDRPAKYFQQLREPSSEHAHERQSELFADLHALPKPSVRRQWLLGSEQECRLTMTAFFHLWWAHFRETNELEAPILWRLYSAWAMNSMDLRRLHPNWNYWTRVALESPPLQRRADWLVTQFYFSGQDKSREKGSSGQKLGFGPHVISGVVSEPTHHEILEAHLFLRDWINQRLPPAKARRWLDFS